MSKQIHIPDSFETSDGRKITFNEIHQRFADSKHGQHLATQIRYKRYKPDCISNTEWCQAPLGADVNNLQHMPLTKALTREFLKHQLPEQALSNSDSQVLLLASITHDWAEAITGDIMFDKKSALEDSDEASIMLFMLKKAFGTKLSAETLMQVHQTIKDRNSKLGEIFNAIERVGYMRSGLNAWAASGKPSGELIKGLDSAAETELRVAFQWMASNVAGNQTIALLKYADKYHPVAKYMSNIRNQIDQLFHKMPENVFTKYPTDGESGNEQDQQVQKFKSAQEVWEISKVKNELKRSIPQNDILATSLEKTSL